MNSSTLYEWYENDGNIYCKVLCRGEQYWYKLSYSTNGETQYLRYISKEPDNKARLSKFKSPLGLTMPLCETIVDHSGGRKAKTQKKVKVQGKERVVYKGTRGGEYVKIGGAFKSLKSI